MWLANNQQLERRRDGLNLLDNNLINKIIRIMLDEFFVSFRCNSQRGEGTQAESVYERLTNLQTATHERSRSHGHGDARTRPWPELDDT